MLKRVSRKKQLAALGVTEKVLQNLAKDPSVLRPVTIDTDGIPYGNGMSRLTTIIELLEHGSDVEPALTLSFEGLAGLRSILLDARRYLGGAA
jgi:hypothetical protein